MMHKILPDEWLFKQTFSKLTASPHILEEVIEMTERKQKPKKFILRRLVVAALAMALAAALAMGANAATNGKLFESVMTFTAIGDDGTAYAITINKEAVEQAAEDGEVIYTFTEQEGEKTKMMYRDSEGHMVLKDVELPSDPQEIVEYFQKEVETDKPAAEESSEEGAK